MTSSCYPQSNGLIERINRTLSSILAAYVNSKHANWDECMPYAMFAINMMDQSSTGASHFELVYGRLAVLPTDSCFPWPEEAHEMYEDFKKRVASLRAATRAKCKEAQGRQRRLHDQRRNQGGSFRVGDLVLLRRVLRRVCRSAKFLPRYVGPFRVVQKLSDITYKLNYLKSGRQRRADRIFTAHVAQLKRYRSPMESAWRRSGESDRNGRGRIVAVEISRYDGMQVRSGR
ncbi:hypothetical protein TTRE_0000937501 [Trichuris trichiura]|uniref:Tf2-1-like SH3-like domain-containing protein n=1 Tax=Trichuris trichiura TaxID=36087 RepID=A0A077ZKT7_TRITR|nr:hypothetical protein TTRE_0000937501 [Trichuris trichiura]